ncbi:MAG: FAD binding domain-containing protein [Deltaproteobacteria bacterium]|nr:FAD binding domain-containing protein [Deltaproteobacteria bacterium]
MTFRPFQYHAPATLDEACAHLAEHGPEARVLAGGTDLLVSLKQDLWRPRHLVDVRGLPELLGVLPLPDGGLRLGAARALAEVIAAPGVRAGCPLLAEAAGSVAAPTHQAMGTLGGNLLLDTRCWYYNRSRWQRLAVGGDCFKLDGTACHVAKGVRDCYATFTGDTAAALLVLGASARVTGPSGGRTVPLAGLYTGDGKAPFALRAAEILEAILLPPPPGHFHGAYRKFRLRQALDFPLAGLAVGAQFRAGTPICEEMRLACTGVDTAPRRLPEAEAVFAGREIEEPLVEGAAAIAMRAARPVRNMASTTRHRRAMLGHLCREGLRAVRAARARELAATGDGRLGTGDPQGEPAP